MIFNRENYETYFIFINTGKDAIPKVWLNEFIYNHENSINMAPDAWKYFVKNGRSGIMALKVSRIFSHMWNKARLILLIYYLYQQEIQSRLDYKIGYAKLFSPPEADIKIIRNDFEIIVEKIKAGKAHELSEGDTMYLGAAPKAATSKARRKQPFSNELAKLRAFAFKNSYMTYVLNNYIVPGKDTYEPIMQDGVECAFEDYVISKINAYRDYTVEALCGEFQIECDKKPKNLEAMLAYRMLGIKGNHAEEFENFPNTSENPVCHVRPHAQNTQDTYELPDGRQYPKQCFWLNNHYILTQLKDEFREG